MAQTSGSASERGGSAARDAILSGLPPIYRNVLEHVPQHGTVPIETVAKACSLDPDTCLIMCIQLAEAGYCDYRP